MTPKVGLAIFGPMVGILCIAHVNKPYYWVSSLRICSNDAHVEAVTGLVFFVNINHGGPPFSAYTPSWQAW